MEKRGIAGSLVRGALAGAAGTTALNLATYADMMLRGRAESSAPADTVQAAADAADVKIPGSGEVRQHRVDALGALIGIATGVTVGVLYGAARGFGLNVSRPVAGLIVSATAMLASDAPMTALDVVSPRQWTGRDWAADIVPHLAYGYATAAAFDAT